LVTPSFRLLRSSSYRDFVYQSKIGTSVGAELVDMKEFVPSLPADQSVVFQFGAHAHGPATVDWADKNIAVSQYPLSASVAIGMLIVLTTSPHASMLLL
jgi:rRNA pseudouridine-1189 N-methylase Emg1 (Nep1/Mra1 family)